jgi:hypothetical protein
MQAPFEKRPPDGPAGPTQQPAKPRALLSPHRSFGLAGVALLLVAALGWTAVRRNVEPAIRRQVVSILEARFHCPVELDEVHVSLRHGLQVSGAGLRIRSLDNYDPVRPGDPPMLSVRTFQFDTTLGDLLRHHTSAVTTYAQGLVVTLPAPNDRVPLLPGVQPHSPSRDSRLLNRLIATDSRLSLANRDPSRPPMEFLFEKLILDDPGYELPFVFEAILTNPLPIGRIHSVGHIGPWVSGTPRLTPVDGNFTFDRADLATIAGVSGTMASGGHIAGQLGQMSVHGTADTPDFALDISAHPFHLRTEFQALVDGTSGDVLLQQVETHFLHTTIRGSGLVRTLHDPDVDHDNTHDTALDIVMTDGRAEDLLVLFDKAKRPLVTGSMRLTGHVEVPPGKERLIEKIHALGKVGIDGALWPDPTIQQTVDTLSQRAQNHAKIAMKDPDANPVVSSHMDGSFLIHGANIDVSGLTYRIPGAILAMQGRYPLDGRQIDFRGVARTVANASQMETGWKSLLLKPISPLFKKNGAGMELPVSFTGDKSKPQFAIDWKDHSSDKAIGQTNLVRPKP